MPYFAGFDIASFPGPQPLKWLWDNTNLFWVGFYFPVTGGGPWAEKAKRTWIGKYRMIQDMGWGVAPLYVGKQPWSPMLRGKPIDEGYKDGFEAARMARAEGMPLGSVLYFDLEVGDPPSANWRKYYYAWAEAVLTKLYYPGLYVSYQVVTTPLLTEVTQNLGPFSPYFGRPEVWSFNVDAHKIKNKNFRDPRTGAIITNFEALDPAGSHGAESTSWQYAHGCTLWWKDEKNKGKPRDVPLGPVDMDTSSYKDPGRAGFTLDVPIL